MIDRTGSRRFRLWTSTTLSLLMAALVFPGLSACQQAEPLPMMVVHKTPTCGCCKKWVDHVKAAGFKVEVHDHQSLTYIKESNGVKPENRSCHTALVGGYVVEGHVPAAHVLRLLKEKPDVAGIAVPGMPIGSPGMEGRNPKPYDVVAFDKEGNTSSYARVIPAGS